MMNILSKAKFWMEKQNCSELQSLYTGAINYIYENKLYDHIEKL